jgi:two-component system LytT family response regulator
VTLERPAARLRVLVVDDEPLARRNLMVLLRRDPGVELIGECASGAEAIIEIRKTKPDLLFLDVQMPECDGFDILELLGSDPAPAVVFVTAHDEYALRAFEAGALDYLLKPFEDARFHRALDRAKEKCTQYAARRPRKLERLVIKSEGQIVFLNAPEIDWIEAANYYVSVHVGDSTHRLRRALADLEQALDSRMFCRIHRSVIVNLHRIRGIELQSDGEYEVVLKSKVKLPLSRRFRKNLQERLSVDLLSAPESAI